MRVVFLCIFICFFIFGCFDDMPKKVDEISQKEQLETKIKENIQEATKDLDKSLEETQETPLQKKLKEGLKSHLDKLSNELHAMDLQHLNFNNYGTKKHQEHFQSFSLQEAQNHLNTPQANLQNAQILQQKRIEELRQKNDEIGK